jgi:hypothetical protein
MQPIETRVESVTLYHRGATVRRVATLDFGAGIPRELVVAGLPLSLLDHTLRLRLETDGKDLALAHVRVGLHAPPRGAPPLSPDQRALDDVRAALALARDRIEQLEAETARLVALPVLPRPEPEEGHRPSASPMPARAQLEVLTDELLTKRLALLRSARDEVKGLEEQEAELQRRRQLASSATHVKPDELRKSAHAVLEGSASVTRARLVLEYFVLGARWAPAYQCRMSRDCREAELQLRAMVCQRTGEDWSGARLDLSTAAPMSWTELPELSAIRIGKSQPALSKRGLRPPPPGAQSLFADYDGGRSKARAALPATTAWQPPALSLVPMPAAVPTTFASSSAGAPPELPVMAELAAPEPIAEVLEERREDRAKKRSALPPMPAAAPARAFASRPPAPALAKSTAQGLRSTADGGGGAGSAEASVEVVLYASLRLSGPSEPARGTPSTVDRRASFVASLQALGLTAPFDVLAVVEQAESLGAAVLSAPAPRGTSDVRTEAGWYDYAYRTDAAVDVPSDGRFHSVPVHTRTATSEVLYVAVPREDPQVYRQAQVRNPLSAPLLPGPVEVYVAGEYVLTTALPSVAPGGDFHLALGVEQAIKVARNTRFEEVRSGDKVVATNELVHSLELEVVNNLDREVRCEVRERIPQPAPDAEVVVEEGQVAPAWEPYTQEERGSIIEGGRRWCLAVKAGASQRLSAQYRVKLYANNELVGGNRREA